MKTFVNKKTGNRYPESGVVSWFHPAWSQKLRGDSAQVSSKVRWEHHIKPGYPECTHGWKTLKKKEWSEEDIPDLEEPFTKEQWLAYADKYGDMCAMQFLNTCAYMKPREAFRLRHPPKNEEKWYDPDTTAWFKRIFKREHNDFLDGYLMWYGNTYSLDILKFENHLAREFGYPMHEDGSMKDFMIKTFGEAETDKFELLFLT
jgi:hypothetical protein